MGVSVYEVLGRFFIIYKIKKAFGWACPLSRGGASVSQRRNHLLQIYIFFIFPQKKRRKTVFFYQ